MKAIVLILVVLSSMGTAFASGNHSVGQVQGTCVAATRTEQVLDLYDPDASQANWFNEHNLVVYSRTSRNGEQTDIVRKGNFFDELFIKSGKIHVRRCGNVVYQIAVERSIKCLAGPAGRNGLNGAEGAPGAQGPKGDKGDKGDTGTGITNNYFTSTPVMCGSIGGQSPYMNNSLQLMSLNLVPVSNTNISVSAIAKAPTNIDITLSQQQQQQQQQQQDQSVAIDP